MCFRSSSYFSDVQCRPSLIWESLSNLRGALSLHKNVSYEALKAHKGELNVTVVEC